MFIEPYIIASKAIFEDLRMTCDSRAGLLSPGATDLWMTYAENTILITSASRRHSCCNCWNGKEEEDRCEVE